MTVVYVEHAFKPNHSRIRRSIPAAGGMAAFALVRSVYIAMFPLKIIAAVCKPSLMATSNETPCFVQTRC
jgi:hypothetical protein